MARTKWGKKFPIVGGPLAGDSASDGAWYRVKYGRGLPTDPPELIDYLPFNAATSLANYPARMVYVHRDLVHATFSVRVPHDEDA